MKFSIFSALLATQAATCNGGSAPAPVPTSHPSDIIGLAHCGGPSSSAIRVGTPRLDVLADTVTVDVSYRGGCVAHEMTLCWSGWSTTTQPTQLLGFFVDHYDNGDACTPTVTETLTFDVSELRAQYSVDGGRFGEDEVVYLVFEDGTTLEYDFMQ